MTSILATQRPFMLPSWISTAPGWGGVTVAGDLAVTLFYLAFFFYIELFLFLPAIGVYCHSQ